MWRWNVREQAVWVKKFCGEPSQSGRELLPPPGSTAGKTGSSSGEKGLSLSEGLGKEYMTWRETSVGKTGTQAEGRHVVIRASQG